MKTPFDTNDFNEDYYLETNPDVRLAVLSGQFRNGYDHYVQFGCSEQRAYRPAPSPPEGNADLPNKVQSGFQPLTDALKYLASNEYHGAANVYLAHFATFSPSTVFPIMPSMRFFTKLEYMTPREFSYVLEGAIATSDLFGSQLFDAVFDQSPELAHADFLSQHALVEQDRSDILAKYKLGLGLLKMYPDEDLLAKAAEHILSECSQQCGVTSFAPYYALLRLYCRKDSPKWAYAYRICTYLLEYDNERPPYVDFICALCNYHIATIEGRTEKCFQVAESILSNIPNSDMLHKIGMAYILHWEFSRVHHSIRGWNLMYYPEMAMHFVDEILSVDRSNAPALLLKGLIACHTLDYYGGILALLELAKLNPPHSIYWHLGILYRHKGQLQLATSAFDKHLEINTNITDRPGQSFILSTEGAGQIAWTRFWNGSQQGYVKHVEPQDIGRQAIEPHDASELMTWRRLHQAILANHTFMLYFDFTLKGQPSDRSVLIQSTDAYSFELVVDRNGDLFLSLGDGTCHWDRASNFFICRIGTGAPSRVLIMRDEGQFILYVNDHLELTIPVHKDYTIQGDGLLVGASNKRSDELDFMLHSFSLRIGSIRKEPHWNKIKVMTMYYGDLFSQLLNETMSPSLLTRDGLLGLLADHEISQVLYCTQGELEQAEKYCKKLNAHGIRTEILCKLLSHWEDDIRPVLGEAVIDATSRALQEQAIILFCPPDHVFGRGLANLVRSMKDYQYVVAGHPRITLEEAFPFFKSYLSNPANAESMSNADLVHLAMKVFPHHITSQHHGKKSYWWSSRECADHYEVLFKEPPPLAYYPSRDMICLMTSNPFAPIFETVDHDLPDYLIKTNRLRAVTDSSEFFWTEYCSHFRNYPTISNDYWSHAAQYFRHCKLIWRKHGAVDRSSAMRRF